ncbi:MAG: metallophosphoesterase [Parcubacteria group bacterium]|nr:metallophosphoesterase [Parcubacteria group bacterium]
MKILAIADRPPRTPIRETINEQHPQIIITLGDLDMYDLRGLDDIRDIPKIGVYGNHCSGTYFPDYGIENMHLKTKEIDGVLFGGFEGSIRYKKGDAPMYTEEEASELLKDFPYVDVMLAHSPPKGIHDEDDPAHQGLQALRDYVERMQPKYFLHGHTYVSEGTQEDLLGNTKVVHVYADQILDLST